jgi:hypothetical protein
MIQGRSKYSELKKLALYSLLFAFCTLTAEISSADLDAGHAPAPAANPTTPAVKPAKDGELDVSIQGTRKDKMVVGKYDPPAAFNLEDIQNFPEERLYPVLNNPITFEEGRDFSNMMDSQDEKIIHPWLPEIPRAPFLSMKPILDKPAKDWTFSVIDQGGTPVASQDGKGSPPPIFVWSGEDKDRGYLAVDTVYIPQLSTTDKEGYRHTYMGQPAQFAVLYYRDKGRTVVELSTKRIFVDKKTDLTKEANVFLDKVCDLIRQDSRVPFGLQGYDPDPDLARAREKALQKYFSDKLLVPDTQISLLEPGSSDKRGQAIAVVFNGTPGGSQ